MDADYSDIERRLMLHYCKTAAEIEYGLMVTRYTEMYGAPPDRLNRHQRRAAKHSVFAKQYGGTIADN